MFFGYDIFVLVVVVLVLRIACANIAIESDDWTTS